MLKGVFLTSGYNPALVTELNPDRIFLTSPLQVDPFVANYSTLPNTIPIIRHVYDMRRVLTVQEAQNLQNMPNGAEWYIGNEYEAWKQIPAQTPQEVANAVIANMKVILSVADANAKFVLASGSQNAINTNFFIELITALRSTDSDVLKKFFAISIHYYEMTSHAKANNALIWLRKARRVMLEVGLDDLEMWVTEIGLDAVRFTLKEASQYITDLFNGIKLKQKYGHFQWLTLVSWYLFNHWSLGDYRLLSYPERLTRAGKAFVKG